MTPEEERNVAQALREVRRITDLFDRRPPSLDNLVAEEDENGVVFIRTKKGCPVLMMPRPVYDDILDWSDDEATRPR